MELGNSVSNPISESVVNNIGTPSHMFFECGMTKRLWSHIQDLTWLVVRTSVSDSISRSFYNFINDKIK